MSMSIFHFPLFAQNLITMKRNSKSAKQPKNETTMYKIGSLVGEIAGKISNQKDHLMAMAGNAIESVKTAVHDITEKRKPVAKKAIKKTTKKAAKKLANPIVEKVEKATPTKKAPTTKKIVRKSPKRSVNKVVKTATKKK